MEHTVIVRGFSGEAKGGFQQAWELPGGEVKAFGVRKQNNLCEMEWRSEPIPGESSSESVTLVWQGALGVVLGTLGIGPSHRGDFTLSVNGREAVDFEVAMWPTEFPGRTKDCRLVFNVSHAPEVLDYTTYPIDASGVFYLTVPKDWVKPGESATLKVCAKDRGRNEWFAVLSSAEIPLTPPTQLCKVFRKVEQTERYTPPTTNEEASLEYYRKQFDDNSILTTVGPPGDPSDLAVSTTGQLQYALDRVLPGTPYIANGLSFAVVEGGKAVPFGMEPAAKQTLIQDCLPMVDTKWKCGDWAIEQRTFGRPLRGDSFSSGLESTLGWAVFDIVNQSAQPRELTILVTRTGNQKKVVRELEFHEDVAFEGGSARFCVKTPDGFTQKFLPIYPEQAKVDEKNPLELLRRGGMYGPVAVCGVVPPGERRTIAVCGVFDFQGMVHWKAEPVKVEAAELLARDWKTDEAAAIAEWKKLAERVGRIKTPDETLNRMLVKGMLDGHELTKRWNGRHIAIDSVCYRCQWDDTSMKWFYALDLMGDHATTAALFETVFARQGQRKPAGTRTREGCFTDVTNIERDGSDASWASCNGWALWAFAQHARLADDKAWLKSHKQKILDGYEWIRRERAFSKEKPDNPCAGLVEGKFVCDMPDEWGPGGVGFFTYTDAINYMGMHEMGLLMKEWGYEEAEGMLREAESYRRDIIAAVDRLTDKKTDPWFVPWDLSAPKLDHAYFNGVCGPINLAYAGVLPRNDERIDHVIRWNIGKTHHGSPERSATANMFYSQDLAITLLELGREEEFLRMFYTILASNVSPDTLTTYEWWNNTQPHLHSVSSMIRMARTMLIQERDDALYLLQGVPRRWLEQGKKIEIVELPTNYGAISMTTSSDLDHGKIAIDLKTPDRLGDSPLRLKLRLPGKQKMVGVLVNDRVHSDFEGEWITLKNPPKETTVVVKTAAR
jgi:hypothetical protein